MTSLLRSGTYGLGSLRTVKPDAHPIGRGRYSKAERIQRLAVLRESIVSLFKMLPRNRTLKQIMAELPDAYEIETRDVLKSLTESKHLTRFTHCGRVFYRTTKPGVK